MIRKNIHNNQRILTFHRSMFDLLGKVLEKLVSDILASHLSATTAGLGSYDRW